MHKTRQIAENLLRKGVTAKNVQKMLNADTKLLEQVKAKIIKNSNLTT